MIEWEEFSNSVFSSKDGKIFKTIENGITRLWTVNATFVPVGYGRTDKQALKEFHIQVCEDIEELKKIEEYVRELYDGMDGEE